jgi:hypothetical protein
MRTLCVAIACAIGLGQTLQGQTAGAPALQRVRAMHDAVALLIDEGLRSSSTFRALVDRLMRSDVIVYIGLRPDMSESQGGSLRFMTHTATDRYVQVSLNPRFSRETQVALLGHELQHAVEVAGAPEVTNDRTLRAYYVRTGIRVRENAYDSAAAQAAGRRVRDELSHGAGEVRFARHVRRPDRSDLLLIGSDSIGEPQ